MTSGPSSTTLCKASQSALKSGISTSMVVPGLSFFTSFIVAAQIMEPLSFNSSLFTDVITQCFTSISFTASATLLGSSRSNDNGLPVATAQNEHERVHTFPSIIKVAVPAPQHSPMLGQLPLWQIVCSL